MKRTALGSATVILALLVAAGPAAEAQDLQQKVAP
jgi:hypothetical protein